MPDPPRAGHRWQPCNQRIAERIEIDNVNSRTRVVAKKSNVPEHVNLHTFRLQILSQPRPAERGRPKKVAVIVQQRSALEIHSALVGNAAAIHSHRSPIGSGRQDGWRRYRHAKSKNYGDRNNCRRRRRLPVIRNQRHANNQRRGKEPGGHKITANPNDVQAIQDRASPGPPLPRKKSDRDACANGKNRHRIAPKRIDQVHKALENTVSNGNSRVELCVVRVRQGKSVVEQRECCPDKIGRPPSQSPFPNPWSGAYVHSAKRRQQQQYCVDAVGRGERRNERKDERIPILPICEKIGGQGEVSGWIL